MIPFLCATSFYIVDARGDHPSAFFTLNNPKKLSLSSEATFGKKPSTLLAPFATSPTGAHFSSLSSPPQTSTLPQPKSHQRFTKKMNALHLFICNAICPALKMFGFSPKPGLCSATALLKSSLILSRKTGISWLVFVTGFISTYSQSSAFGLTEASFIYQDNFEF